MRERGKDTWQLRVYVGIDPNTRKQRWLAKTVYGSRGYATKQLQDLLEEAGRGRLRAGTVSDLLEHSVEVSSLTWAVSTAGHTRTVIDCYITP